MNNRPLILIVDHNPAMLDVLEMILSAQYDIMLMDQGKHIIKRVTENRPGLIIMDKNLGLTDGCDCCATLKAHPVLCTIPVIMLSSNTTVRNQCLQAGADEFIEKPFSINFFEERVAWHLAPRQTMQM